MTKYEWERELKKHLSDLPESEKQRIQEYFGELFEDKFESGMNEYEIIAEFGEPEEAARKIKAEFAQEQKSVSADAFKSGNAAEFVAPAPSTEPKPEKEEEKSAPNEAKNKKRRGCNALSLCFKIIAYILFISIFGTVFIALIAAVFSIAVAVVATGGALALGGAASLVLALVYALEVGISWVAVLGFGIIAIGVGLLILAFSRAIMKTASAITKFLFKGIGGMFARRKEIAK